MSKTTLAIGSKDKQGILDAQTKLQKTGFYKSDIDGDYGPITEKAVTDFQTRYLVTGQIDEYTAQKLDEIAAKYNPDANPIALDDLKIKQILLNSNEYIHEETGKSCITLHLTAGSGSAFFTRDSWNLDAMKGLYSVGTHFIIAGDYDFPKNPAYNCKSGEIYQTIPLEGWAYHVNWSQICNKFNIGIENCNYGPAVKQGYGYMTAAKVVLEEKEIEKLPWANVEYWHRLTDDQIHSMWKLCKALMKRYPEIEAEFRRQKIDQSWSNLIPGSDRGLKGIRTHVNFVAPPDRFDIPPFPRVLEMLNSL